jgi:hypothetical protein
VLIFLHIPKTGGVSLSTTLAARFPSDQVFHIVSGGGASPRFSALHGSCDDLRRQTDAARSRLRCVLGHFHLAEAVHEALPAPWGYVTILRDPVSRVTSQLAQFNRMVRAGDMPGHDAPVGLATFAALRPNSVDNHQTRFLCGGGYPDRSGEENLARAKENLRRWFRVVGTTERYDDTLRVLQGAYGWEGLQPARLNATRRRERTPLTGEEVAWLRARNAWDLALHAFAGELLEARMAQLAAEGRLPEPASGRGRFSGDWLRRLLRSAARAARSGRRR